MIEQLNTHKETDDNDNEALYRILTTMHDPEILSIPEEDEQNISTCDALKANDAEKFKVAIIQEVTDLTKTTRILTPLSKQQVKALGRYWKIGTTLNCKRKKKGNGLPGKHKARGAARGDSLVANEDPEGRITLAFNVQPNSQQATHIRIHDADSHRSWIDLLHDRHQGSVL